MENTPRVIINADDYGLNEHCSKAIAQAFAEGLITDTTMMATGEYFDPAVTLAQEQGFFSQIGIHLNLTEGKPLTEDILQFPSLTENGVFCRKNTRNQKLSKEEQDAVYQELSAQIKRLEDAGITITHADSHHHIHTDIYIAPIAHRVCKEHGITKLRLHRNVGAIPFYKKILKNRFNKQIQREGFCTTDYFAYPMDVQGADIPDNTEIMVHPDYNDDGVLIDRTGASSGVPSKPLPDFRAGRKITLRGYAQL